MEYFEDPIFPPDGDGHGKSFESADLDIEQLELYINSTVYENEDAVVTDLTKRYGMSRRDSISSIEMNMTREFQRIDISDMFRKIAKGETLPNMDGEPESGEEPKLVISTEIHTINEEVFDLTVYEVMNKNRTHYEYILLKKN